MTLRKVELRSTTYRFENVHYNSVYGSKHNKYKLKKSTNQAFTWDFVCKILLCLFTSANLCSNFLWRSMSSLDACWRCFVLQSRLSICAEYMFSFASRLLIWKHNSIYKNYNLNVKNILEVGRETPYLTHVQLPSCFFLDGPQVLLVPFIPWADYLIWRTIIKSDELIHWWVQDEELQHTILEFGQSLPMIAVDD